MKKNDAYIWCSPATDVTGKVLMERLNIVGGTAKPPTTKKHIITWGAKTAENVNLEHANDVLNHPNNIKDNRNKFKALAIMKDAGINVAPFSTNIDALTLPVIGRRNYHQGGKGFWVCLTKNHAVEVQAEEKGAQYFQEYIDIKQEWRLHVFDGKVIYAVKKIKRDNLQTAYVEKKKEKIINFATKNNVALDNDTVDFVLKRIARDEAEHADLICRGNSRGWKFSNVTLNNTPTDLCTQAIKAIEALGLTYGAVDCCQDYTDKCWVIEVNSGPGLDGTALDKWVDAFEELFKTAQAVPAPGIAANTGAIANKHAVAPTGKKVVNKGLQQQKEALKAQMLMAQDLLAAADSEEEVAVLKKTMLKAFDN